MSRLTRDGTAKPVSRDHILRFERGHENIIFPWLAHHEQDRNLSQMIKTLGLCVTIHKLMPKSRGKKTLSESGIPTGTSYSKTH